MPSKISYIEQDLEWLRGQAEELKAYCDSNKIPDMKDRIVGKKVVATVEQQITSKRQTLYDHIKILEAIKVLEEKEATKKQLTRGDQELTPMETGDI